MHSTKNIGTINKDTQPYHTEEQPIMLQSLVTMWLRFGTAIFPPTIHPMIVHFPIALLYLTLLIEIIGFLIPRQDRFFDRAGFWALTLSLLAIVSAAAAGMISEQFVKWTPATLPILYAHQRDAVLTGVFALGAWFVRWFAHFPTVGRQQSLWSIWHTGRGRQSLLDTILVIAAVIMVSLTGTLGGSMVYNHGVGVSHVTRIKPKI